MNLLAQFCKQLYGALALKHVELFVYYAKHNKSREICGYKDLTFRVEQITRLRGVTLYTWHQNFRY